MKEYLEKLNEAGVVTFLIVAASIAIVFVVVHATWKGITGELPKDDEPKQPPDPAEGDCSLIEDPAPSMNNVLNLRRELFLKNHHQTFKTTLPRRKALITITRWS
ncbi:MAG: hypothetical protein ABSE48_05850 [Verrucomicrobiota bacterium]|jgi:hypothetical protein